MLARIADVIGRGEVEDGFALAAQRDALITGRQESAAPVHRAAARTTRPALEHDEPRQVVRRAAEPVGRPCAHARPAELRRAGVHEELCRRVVEHVRRAGADEAHVVHDPRRARKQLAHPHSGLPVAAEGALRSEQLGLVLERAVHEREPLAREIRIGDRLAVELRETRLGVEQVELRRPAGHEEVDDVLGAGRMMRRLRRERMRRRRCRGERAAVQQRTERDGAQPEPAAAEEVAAGESKQRFGRRRSHGRVRKIRRLGRAAFRGDAARFRPSTPVAWQPLAGG